jgi:hypothetical protein
VNFRAKGVHDLGNKLIRVDDGYAAQAAGGEAVPNDSDGVEAVVHQWLL